MLLASEDIKQKQNERTNERTNETEREGRGRHAGFTPSIAFRHLPPNSCRISYATEGALFISAQLSERVRVLIKLQTLVYDRGRCRKAVLGVWVLI